MNDYIFDSVPEEKQPESSLNLRPDCNIESILATGKSARALGVIIIVLFIGILLSFLVNFGVSAYLGSEELVNSYYDGEEHANIVFSDFADTFYLSETIRHNIVRVDYYLFRRLPTDSALLGRNDFLFPTYDEKSDYNYVADYLGEIDLSTEEINCYYTSVREITAAYKELGAKCYFVIIPNSQTVYPERMPGYMGNISEETRLKSVSTYLTQHGVTNFLDLTDSLMRAKDQGELYNNTEDSLNSRGAYYAYLAVLDMLPKEATSQIRRIDLADGDLVLHSTTGKELARAATLENVIKNRTVSLSTDFVQKYQVLLRYDTYEMAFAKIQYKAELPSLPRVAIQFSSDWDRIIMIDYFSNTFGITIYRTSLDFNTQVITKTDPSYIICFIHERDLSVIADGSMLPKK